jgi:hypothetical protein
VPENTDRMLPRILATMTALAVLAPIASAAPVRAECEPARLVARLAKLPEPWRAALDDLIRSTAELGHPWSCSGGTIELELDPSGAVLSVAREGQDVVRRTVASPPEVLPLGEALLAMPLTAAGPELGEPAETAPASDRVQPKAAEDPARARSEVTRATTKQQVAPTASDPNSRRLLLAAGLDVRAVGGSNLAWIGPTVTAAVQMGRWLPLISLRQQSALGTDGPSIDELSVAIAVQMRFEISKFELRVGPALRGAVVQRDLSRRRGDQSRVEGRLGAVTSFALPVFSWGKIVLSADAEVVMLSRETAAEPETSSGDDAPRAFPTYTLGGSACFEVAL